MYKRQVTFRAIVLPADREPDRAISPAVLSCRSPPAWDGLRTCKLLEELMTASWLALTSRLTLPETGEVRPSDTFPVVTLTLLASSWGPLPMPVIF